MKIFKRKKSKNPCWPCALDRHEDCSKKENRNNKCECVCDGNY